MNRLRFRGRLGTSALSNAEQIVGRIVAGPIASRAILWATARSQLTHHRQRAVPVGRATRRTIVLATARGAVSALPVSGPAVATKSLPPKSHRPHGAEAM